MDTGAPIAHSFTLADLLAAATGADFPAFQARGGLSAEAQSFLSQIFADATAEELQGLALSDLLAAAHAFWADTATIAAWPYVRLTAWPGARAPALQRTILDIAGPDRPFLVDSVMAEVAAQGLSALALVHPLVACARSAAGARQPGAGRESYIQVHLPALAPARAEALEAGVRAVLADVAAATEDFPELRSKMLACAAELEAAKTPAKPEDVAEAVAFLRWLADDNFIFQGARDYQFPRDSAGEFIRDEPTIVEDSGLGILRDPNRYVLRRGSEPAVVTQELKRTLEQDDPVIVAKSSFESLIHRRAPGDYVGVKRYAADGQVIGETRFVGLFTSDAYNEMTRDIPFLRAKAARVLERAGFTAGSHNARVLQNIVETYPRDELFQIEDDALLHVSLAILHLLDRPRPRLFVRRDRFNRFIVALAFLPKDKFNSTLRAAVGARLTAAYGGQVAAFYPELGDGPLARIRFLVQDIDKSLPEPDLAALEREITALTFTWPEALAAALLQAPGAEAAAARFSNAFSGPYRETFSPAEAVADLHEILAAREDESVRVRAYRRPGAGADELSCKIYARGGALALSSTLPVLENMGLFIESESPYTITPADGPKIVMHDFLMRSVDGAALDADATQTAFEEAFAAIWTGRAENDGFNRLILKLGVSWREAGLLRGLARFRTQTGLDPSQRVQEDALIQEAAISRMILGAFRVRFDPDLPEPIEARRDWAAQLDQQIKAALDKVTSLDADRVLRRIAALVFAIQRTNYYQTDAAGQPKAYISLKIASRELADLPEPKPYREIWVSAPEVEGVHLRFGPVARGGLRWSDRRDDFRSEVLDLVKAQQVKNAIIVPVGAKGGFFPKKLPARGQPGYAEGGKSAYKTFLRGMLDLTDNLADGAVKPPARVVRWDGDDPYLVAAADKGTATFSDTANALAAEYGFWLGDAYASGGSVGYDHKAMGITAKGAWEAVKRHFREMGKDTQTEHFKVIGVGDMSGDVFGNGMLLSGQIRLIAAFDHRDIFLDPNPQDLAASFSERARMFALTASSWKDYDRALISPGGGVFSRQEKAIQLSPEAAAAFGLKPGAIAPADLMHALLKAPCDLLWFGGIGTFIKARSESHADASDKTNDTIRVDAEDVQALVIGEGANLGLTQAARIAFARKGGRINTDAVDNSAGVDTSDHEVNIKILLAEAQRTGALKPEARNPLLAAMTGEVAQNVLRHNHQQTLALSLAQAQAGADIDAHERLIEGLEKSGKLSRAVEGLPNAEEFRARRTAGMGLTRPELAKLLAYAKIDLFDALVASAAPDDPYFQSTLEAYFPAPLSAYGDAMRAHRLKREIIATRIADDLVNMGGPTFIQRVRETIRADAHTIALAFEAGRQIFNLDALWRALDAADSKTSAAWQMPIYQEIGRALRRICLFLVRRSDAPGVAGLIGAYQKAVAAQAEAGASLLSPFERAGFEAHLAAHRARGAPDDIANEAALLPALMPALDVADLAARSGAPIMAAAQVFHAVGAGLQLDELRAAAGELALGEHWERLGLRRTQEDLYEDQSVLARHALVSLGKDGAPADAIQLWMDGLGARAAGSRQALSELRSGGGWSFAKIVIAAAEVRSLAAAVSAQA